MIWLYTALTEQNNSFAYAHCHCCMFLCTWMTRKGCSSKAGVIQSTHLKLDYRTHLSKSGRVANHCSILNLSDTQNSAWRKKCDHNHEWTCLIPSLTCFRCNACVSLRLLYRLKQHVRSIINWKKLLHASDRNGVRQYILAKFDEESVFFCCWLYYEAAANKISKGTESFFRETQSRLPAALCWSYLKQLLTKSTCVSFIINTLRHQRLIVFVSGATRTKIESR